MRCRAPLRRVSGLLIVLPLLAGSALDARATVQISVSSGTVATPGDTAQICVSLSTGGQEVAGTENRLVWDGSCATLPPSKGSCFAAGSHGKQLSWDFPPNTDFTMKALVLSLTDVDPMGDGVLYCCNFQGEAAAGSCCSITVVAPGASDSAGNAIRPVLGSSGRLCTAQSQGGGAIGNVNPGSALGAGGGAPVADAPVAPVAPVANPAAAPAAPAAQVLQGGGGGVVVPTAAPAAAQAPAPPAPADPSPAVAPADPSAATAAGPTVSISDALATRAAAAATAAAAQRTAAAAPTGAATSVATAIPTAPAETPTAAATTTIPASTPTVPAPTRTASGGGWFGCQVGGGVSAAPVLTLAALFAALAWARRRSTRTR